MSEPHPEDREAEEQLAELMAGDPVFTEDVSDHGCCFGEDCPDCGPKPDSGQLLRSHLNGSRGS